MERSKREREHQNRERLTEIHREVRLNDVDFFLWLKKIQKTIAIFPLSPDINSLSLFRFPRVTLYAEFLPMKARAKCILLIEVRRMVWEYEEYSVSEQQIPCVLSHGTKKVEFKKNIICKD